MIDDEHLWDIACGEPGPATWAVTRGVSVIRFFRYGTTYDHSVLFICGRELRFMERSLLPDTDVAPKSPLENFPVDTRPARGAYSSSHEARD